jgi:hypothetical protein
LADGIGQPTTAQTAIAVPVTKKLRVAITIEGSPPSQTLKVTANRQVEVARVDYMLSNETTVGGEDVSEEGASIEIAVNDALFLKVWNTPRYDRNFSDHSGPAKIGLTVVADGDAMQYILPVQMESTMLNNTMFRKLVGSKTFYGS